MQKGRPFRDRPFPSTLRSDRSEIVAILLVADEAELADRRALDDRQGLVDLGVLGVGGRLEVQFRLGVHGSRLVQILTQRHLVDGRPVPGHRAGGVDTDLVLFGIHDRRVFLRAVS